MISSLHWQIKSRRCNMQRKLQQKLLLFYVMLFALSEGRQISVWRLLPSHNDTVAGFPPLYMRSGESVEMCATWCTEVGNCDSFFYEQSTKTCRLHRCRFDDTTTLVYNQNTMYFARVNGRSCSQPESKGYMEAGNCKRGKEMSNNFIRVYLDKKSWSDSKTACESDGGHLATIACSDMQEWISNYILSIPDFPKRCWIDGNDQQTEGIWVDWLNQPLEWTNWTQQPNNAKGEEHCCEIRYVVNKWNDARCSLKLAYICQLDEQTLV